MIYGARIRRRLGQSRCWAAAAAVAGLLANGPTPAETLEQAWQRALDTDRSLEAAASRVDAAGAALDAARDERKPRLTATSAYTRWRDVPAFDFARAGVPVALPLFSGRGFALSTAHVSVPLYSGGMIGARIDAADASLSARGSARDALTQDVKLGVAERYVEVLRAESALAVARADTASLRAHARDVEDMLASGQVPRNDLLAASVSLADAEQHQLRSENKLERARSAYNRATGRDLAAPVALEAKLPEIAAALAAAPVQTLLETALESRAELAGLTAAATELEARAAAAQAQAKPQLTASGGYTALENQFLDRENFWTLGLSITWNAFDGGRARHAAAAFERQADAAGAERAQRVTAIELEVRNAWLDRQETEQRITVTERAVDQAEENLRVMLDRYRSGEGTNSEVLDAEALRSLAHGNFDNARYDAALARFRLARAVGML